MNVDSTRRTALGALALGVTALAGCGFHLRQAPQFAFHSIAVLGNSRFVNLVRRNLSTAGTVQMIPAADAKQAQVVLEVPAEAHDRLVVGASSAQLITEMTLQLRVRFVLRDQAGRELLGPAEITQRRDISYNETNALAKADEETLLFRDMESDIAQQLLRRVAALKSL